MYHDARGDQYLDRALHEWMVEGGRHMGVFVVMILGSNFAISKSLPANYGYHVHSSH